MKYTDKFLNDYGIKISIISENTFNPKLVISVDKYEELYELNANVIQDIQSGKSLDIVESYIESFIRRNQRYFRKKKLKRLSEI